MLLMLSQIQTLMLRLPLCKPRTRRLLLRSQPPLNQLVEMRVLELRDNTNQEKKVLVSSEVAEAASEVAAVVSEVVTDNNSHNTDQRLQQLKAVTRVSFTE